MVCLADHQVGDLGVILPCNHIFHRFVGHSRFLSMISGDVALTVHTLHVNCVDCVQGAGAKQQHGL